jgi:hypothetical protein
MKLSMTIATLPHVSTAAPNLEALKSHARTSR